MPRIANRFTIPQLKNMLQSRLGQVDSLMRERNQLQKQLDLLDEKIRGLGGDVRGGGGGGAASSNAGGNSLGFTAAGRARNEKSLVDSIADVLEKAGKAITVGEILDGVKASGYRSNSANFRGIINQTLIKERKKFANAGRGLYAMK